MIQLLIDNPLLLLFVVGMLMFAAALAFAAHRLLHLKVTLTASMFAGSLTNTPALAGILEYIKSYAPAAGGDSLDQMLAEPVVGYSITYPVGVVGMILTGENNFKRQGDRVIIAGWHQVVIIP